MSEREAQPPVLEKRPGNKPARGAIRLLTVAAGVIALVLVGYGVWRQTLGSDRARTQSILKWAGLGPLADSATNLMFHQWSGVFTGETYAKFRLSSEDLQKFILRASALTDWKCEVFTPNHQLGAASEWDSSRKDVLDHTYILRDHSFPNWFEMTVRQKGRRYEHVYGSMAWIVINEQDNTVFIWLVKG